MEAVEEITGGHLGRLAGVVLSGGGIKAYLLLPPPSP